MKRHFAKNKLISVGVIVVALLLVGIIGYVAKSKVGPKPVMIPASIADKLLFTPYILAKLPEGYKINESSFTKQEEALLFSAVNDKGDKLLFSEQEVPKNFDISAFYSSSLKSPTRLTGLKNEVVYGQLTGQSKSLAGIKTSDDTWVLIIGNFTKQDAISFNQNLVPQN